MESMMRRINRLSAYVLVPLAAGSLFFADWKFSLSVLIGGLIGVMNLKGIAWSVGGLLGADKARAGIVALSMFKLMLILLVLVILAALKMINPYGLLVGFTVVFTIIVKEGFHQARIEKEQN